MNDYDRLVKKLAKVFDVSEQRMRRHIQDSVMPGSTALTHARELLHKVRHSTPRQLANICRKNGTGLHLDYERLLIAAEKVRREARRKTMKEAR